MRIISLALFALTLINTSAAPQTKSQQDPPAIVILKFSWNDYVYRPDWDRDQYRTPIQAANDEREQIEKNRSSNARAGALPPMPEYRRKQTIEGTKRFQYRVTVKNTGEKTIKTIAWDYVFVALEGQKDVARHSFVSKDKIKPGANSELIRFSIAQPIKVVSVRALENGNARQPYKERVVIKKIEYTDGSIWQRP